MPKDARYRTAQKLILAGQIKTLSDLFDAVDVTPLARDIHTAPIRLSKLIQNPALFTFQDCYAIAEVLGVGEQAIVDIVHRENMSRKKKKK